MLDDLRNSGLSRTLGDFLTDLADLVQKEIRLARAEVSEKNWRPSAGDCVDRGGQCSSASDGADCPRGRRICAHCVGLVSIPFLPSGGRSPRGAHVDPVFLRSILARRRSSPVENGSAT